MTYRTLALAGLAAAVIAIFIFSFAINLTRF
jgi:hypothetical protein